MIKGLEGTLFLSSLCTRIVELQPAAGILLRDCHNCFKAGTFGVSFALVSSYPPLRNLQISVLKTSQMAPGNAWHFPGNAEFPANDGMRSPVFPTDIVKSVTIFSGNQWNGGGNAANQLQDGSEVSYKHPADNGWRKAPMEFVRQIGNNKYFRATIPIEGLAIGSRVQYYLKIAYSDRETTYLRVQDGDQTGLLSQTVTVEAAAQASPFIFTIDTRKTRGEWSEPFPLPNVGAHAHLLRTGKVLMWGRRDNPQQSMNVNFPNPPVPRPNEPGARADPATCTPFLLDLDTKKTAMTGQPTLRNGKNSNLFCAGHAFQQDGTLLVAGGHITDGEGLDQSSIYDPGDGSTVGTWKAGPTMGKGRWYPTVTALPTSTVLVASGSYRDLGADSNSNNNNTQIFDEKNGFVSISSMPDKVLDLYPRMHVASTGFVYALSLNKIWFLDLSADEKQWRRLETAEGRPLTDYGCSVMYDTDKVMFVGGGTPPGQRTDIINLSDHKNIKWEGKTGMNFARRQHNATVLPDGTVFVTGGTRGSGDEGIANAADVKFNDIRPGRPVHIAELWDPKADNGKGKWTMMAAEQTNRCYHSTAVLLPDGRVLSAGGGEFQLGLAANAPEDSHRDAQIFSPPYLFQGGQRPSIESISETTIQHRSTFVIGTADAAQIDKVSLVGLSSVTHSINTGQRLSFLEKTVASATVLRVSAPPNAKSCPPGYYMLFLVDKRGVPSVAKMVQIVSSSEALVRHRGFTTQLVAAKNKPPTVLERRREIRETADGTRVEVGISPTCPYGLSACWGGAFEALSDLEGVEHVDPMPHTSGSTASVFLSDNGLPDLNLWTNQFQDRLRETYGLRGFEAAIVGTVEKRDGTLVLAAEGVRPDVKLRSIEPKGKIQWDKNTQRPQTVTEEEAGAYDTLQTHLASSDTAGPVAVTGPITQTEAGYTLQVRLIKW
jgi:galactose oxidase